MNKTIEERAKEYADPVLRTLGDEMINKSQLWLFEKRAFISGAKSEREELTRWNEPECPPDGPHEVLAKIWDGYYKVVEFDSNINLYKVSGTKEWIEIFCWREIHE